MNKKAAMIACLMVLSYGCIWWTSIPDAQGPLGLWMPLLVYAHLGELARGMTVPFKHLLFSCTGAAGVALAAIGLVRALFKRPCVRLLRFAAIALLVSEIDLVWISRPRWIPFVTAIPSFACAVYLSFQKAPKVDRSAQSGPIQLHPTQ